MGRNHLAESVHKIDNLCPEGREDCISQCKYNKDDEFATSGCVKRCMDFCHDESEFSGCKEGKPRCYQSCKKGFAQATSAQKPACFARCDTACCPNGEFRCKENCDDKPNDMI